MALASLLTLTAAQIFAQGTVAFNNRVSGFINNRIYIYTGPGPANYFQTGNGTADTPSGTTDWTGFTGLTGSGWMAAILGAVGVGLSESQLSFGANPTTTTFRSGVNAGGFAVTTATLNQIPRDAAAATLDVFVWDRAGSGITDPAAAYAAWRSGSVIWTANSSGPFTVSNIGGQVNTPPFLTGMPSFSVGIPEPGMVPLAGLGVTVFFAFHRRRR